MVVVLIKHILISMKIYIYHESLLSTQLNYSSQNNTYMFNNIRSCDAQKVFHNYDKLMIIFRRREKTFSLRK